MRNLCGGSCAELGADSFLPGAVEYCIFRPRHRAQALIFRVPHVSIGAGAAPRASTQPMRLGEEAQDLLLHLVECVCGAKLLQARLLLVEERHPGSVGRHDLRGYCLAEAGVVCFLAWTVVYSWLDLQV